MTPFPARKTTPRYPVILCVLLLAIVMLSGGCQAPAQEPVKSIPSRTNTATNTPTSTPISAQSATPQPTAIIPTAEPSLTATPTTTICTAVHGQVSEIILQDETGTGSLPVQVYLPPCHPVKEDIPYPLLVLLHGQGYDQNHWLDLGLAEAADQLITSGQMPPMIILMPFEKYAYYNPYDSSFDAMIIHFLLPWAAENYSVCQGANCRAVGGISRGGSWALHMGSDFPGVFGGIGMHSAAPFPADQYRLVRVLGELPERQRPGLFIDVGDTDTYRSYIHEFHEDLAAQGVVHTWNTAEGGHNDAYWHTHLEEYLLWYGAILPSP